MPWKECSVVEERLRFVARLLDGEAMTELCREFGISRKTGYKIFDRYKEHGLEALCDRSRRPVRYANQLPSQVESLIVSLKRNKPHWGARKIRELLLRRLPGDLRLPAKSTIHAVLDRHGLVKRMGKRRSRATGTPLSKALAPNDLWCADFKGEFKLGNGRYCYPLTVTDQASRFLLMCEALDTTREDVAVTAFERLFADRGLPQAIRSDNGVPFASPDDALHRPLLARCSQPHPNHARSSPSSDYQDQSARSADQRRPASASRRPPASPSPPQAWLAFPSDWPSSTQALPMAPADPPCRAEPDTSQRCPQAKSADARLSRA